MSYELRATSYEPGVLRIAYGVLHAPEVHS